MSGPVPIMYFLEPSVPPFGLSVFAAITRTVSALRDRCEHAHAVVVERPPLRLLLPYLPAHSQFRASSRRHAHVAARRFYDFVPRVPEPLHDVEQVLLVQVVAPVVRR